MCIEYMYTNKCTWAYKQMHLGVSAIVFNEQRVNFASDDSPALQVSLRRCPDAQELVLMGQDRLPQPNLRKPPLAPASDALVLMGQDRAAQQENAQTTWHDSFTPRTTRTAAGLELYA